MPNKLREGASRTGGCEPHGQIKTTSPSRPPQPRAPSRHGPPLQAARAFLAPRRPEERYLVAVSGGCDSVVLLHVLLELGYRHLTVCHLDHQLRGRASATDARFVARLAARHHLDFVLGTTNVAARAGATQQSIETAAREARYEFFAKVSQHEQCFTLFLGHHADDQVETFLFNLFRGSGSFGLRGMLPEAQRKTGAGTLTLLRPLLEVWRDDIRDYARAHRIKFREDQSNKSLDHQRNRIRRKIIPYLERVFGREIRQAIWRAATVLRAEDEFIGRFVTPQPLPSELPVALLRNAPLALQRRMINSWLRHRGIDRVGFREIENVRALLTSRAAKINLPGGAHVRRRAKLLFIDGRPPESH